MEQRQKLLNDVRKFKLAPRTETTDAEIQQLEAEADRLQKQAVQTLEDGYVACN